MKSPSHGGKESSWNDAPERANDKNSLQCVEVDVGLVSVLMETWGGYLILVFQSYKTPNFRISRGKLMDFKVFSWEILWFCTGFLIFRKFRLTCIEFSTPFWCNTLMVNEWEFLESRCIKLYQHYNIRFFSIAIPLSLDSFSTVNSCVTSMNLSYWCHC